MLNKIQKIDFSNIDYPCLGIFYKDDNGEKLINFEDNSKFLCCDYLLTPYIDTTYFGYYQNLKHKYNGLDNFLDVIKENTRKTIQSEYLKLSSDEYLNKVVLLMKEYYKLLAKAKKFKRMREGNPEVNPFLDFQKEHRDEILKFGCDIAEWEFRDIEEEMKPLFFNHKAPYSNEERREVMKENFVQFLNDSLLYDESEFNEAKTEFASCKEAIEKYLPLIDGNLYLIPLGFNGKYLLKNKIVRKAEEFSIEDYLFSDKTKNYIEIVKN